MVQILEQIRLGLAKSAHPHIGPVWAIIACMVFLGFFRLGELLLESPAHLDPATSLCWGDMAADSQEHDPHPPQKVQRPDRECRTGNTLYPLVAILHYIVAQGSALGPFFLNTDSHIITKAWFVDWIHDISWSSMEQRPAPALLHWP